jgi:hypothetical protein
VNNEIAAICPCPPVTASQSEFEDGFDVLNTGAAKVAGQCVYDLTSLRPLYADGDTDISPWRDAAGVIVYTPVASGPPIFLTNTGGNSIEWLNPFSDILTITGDTPDLSLTEWLVTDYMSDATGDSVPNQPTGTWQTIGTGSNSGANLCFDEDSVENGQACGSYIGALPYSDPNSGGEAWYDTENSSYWYRLTVTVYGVGGESDSVVVTCKIPGI